MDARVKKCMNGQDLVHNLLLCLHHDTKSNSSYVSTYLVINLFLILIIVYEKTVYEIHSIGSQ